MLFLGHLSFDERKDGGRFGHFTCVVDVKTPGAAEKSLKKLIRGLTTAEAFFDHRRGPRRYLP